MQRHLIWRLLFPFLTLLNGPQALAVDVAFIEIKTPDGKLLQLEPNGRFAHVAISHKGGWLHAHPKMGVSWTRSLSSFGRVAMILSNPEILDPTEKTVQSLLGKPYDFSFRWEENESFYCSELVGKLLHIEPEPMDFSATIWKPELPQLTQGPGLSPDDLYRIFSASPRWRPNCSQWLLTQ